MKWGLLGAGKLLDRWIKGFRQIEDAEIAGIASRTIETAEKRASELGISSAMTYEEMLKQKDIDIIYIAVPHTAHKDLAIRAMEAGFPVLVEKPAAVTAYDWDEMTTCAERNHVFLMEAVWTLFFPAIRELYDRINSGEIGDIRCIQSAFAYRIPDDYHGRLTDPRAAGGALLDVGVYNLHLAQFLYGESPVRWAGLASFDTNETENQIDEQEAYIGQYADGALSILSSAIRTEMPDTAWIYGTKGMIRIPTFWKAGEFEIIKDGISQTFSLPVPQKIPGIIDEGYQFEISHVQKCIRSGLAESPVVTHSITRSVLSQCDELRGQWKLRYPFEQHL
ncbi:MAG: Gfo/Idh/MocA family oxidoreductase [Anaerolineaceae bacterium]|nr:Gfo/Idh/MocA family oxidoreductase [Anaerolineaceae bacterium]